MPKPNPVSEEEIDAPFIPSADAEKLFQLIIADDVEGIRRMTHNYTVETSTTHLIALTDLILRDLVMADDDSIQGRQTTILEPVHKGVLALNQMVLGTNIKQGIQKVMDDYNKHKNNPLMKTLIAHDNEIEIPKEKITALEQTQKAQDHKLGEQSKTVSELVYNLAEQAKTISEYAQKIANLESFINKHFGINFGVSNNNSDEGIHDLEIDISGSHHDSAGYTSEFS